MDVIARGDTEELLLAKKGKTSVANAIRILSNKEKEERSGKRLEQSDFGDVAKGVFTDEQLEHIADLDQEIFVEHAEMGEEVENVD